EIKLLGTPLKRVEDRRLLIGEDQFLDNITFPRMAYAGFVRSPYAHARIKKIDLSRVKREKSVVAILTSEEVLAQTDPVPVLWRIPDASIHEHYALTHCQVKHVGDPVLALAVNER